jgi:hypothetical protein
MTDFLSRLAARALGAVDSVQPLVGSRYGEGGSLSGFTEQTVEREAEPAARGSLHPVLPPGDAPARASLPPASASSAAAPQAGTPPAATSASKAVRPGDDSSVTARSSASENARQLGGSDRTAPPSSSPSPPLITPADPASVASAASASAGDGAAAGAGDAADGLLVPGSTLSGELSNDPHASHVLGSEGGTVDGFHEVVEEVTVGRSTRRRSSRAPAAPPIESPAVDASPPIRGSDPAPPMDAHVAGPAGAPLMPLSPVAGPVVQRYAAPGAGAPSIGAAEVAAEALSVIRGTAGDTAIRPDVRVDAPGLEAVEELVDAPPRSSAPRPVGPLTSPARADASPPSLVTPVAPSAVPTAAPGTPSSDVGPRRVSRREVVPSAADRIAESHGTSPDRTLDSSPSTEPAAAHASTDMPQVAGRPAGAGDGMTDEGLLMPPSSDEAARFAASGDARDGALPGEVVTEVDAPQPVHGQPSAGRDEPRTVASSSVTSTAPGSVTSRNETRTGTAGDQPRRIRRESVQAARGDDANAPAAARTHNPPSPRASAEASSQPARESADGLLMPRVGEGGEPHAAASSGARGDGGLREVAAEVDATSSQASAGPPSTASKRSLDTSSNAPANAARGASVAGTAPRAAERTASPPRSTSERREVVQHVDGFTETVTLGEAQARGATAAGTRSSSATSTALATTRRGEPIAVQTRAVERGRADDSAHVGRKQGARDGRAGEGERPTIRISIGRIEVKAVHPPAPVAPQPAAQSMGWRPPTMSLDQYLKRGTGR